MSDRINGTELTKNIKIPAAEYNSDRIDADSKDSPMRTKLS